MRLLLVVLMLIAGPVLFAGQARAADGLWVDATGFAIQTWAEDAASAKRRAVADALLMAALSGGASVRGHTAVDKSVITADLLIVRPVGRVLRHEIVSVQQTGDTWQATIRALVGVGPQSACNTRRTLVVTAYAPQIDVSPNAPAWTVPLAQEVANRLVERLERHKATDLVRVTNRAMPDMTAAREALDYEVLTRGSVRLADGEHGFVPVIRLDVGGMGATPELTLELEMVLVGGNGEVARQSVLRQVALPGASPLGRVATLVQPNRRQMAARLTDGLEAEMTALLDVETCKPVLTRLAVGNGAISAPVGRKQGLTRGSIAFTADSDASTELLEVVELGASRVVLRPLDPNRPARAFDGRPVRFVEAGL
jgi:hypothetical protein